MEILIAIWVSRFRYEGKEKQLNGQTINNTELPVVVFRLSLFLTDVDKRRGRASAKKRTSPDDEHT